MIKEKSKFITRINYLRERSSYTNIWNKIIPDRRNSKGKDFKIRVTQMVDGQKDNNW